MELTHNIKRLTEDVINQINAGEVIERPQHIVKELIENALDAGALHIDVSLLEGGTKEILVKDDGCGIPPEELTLAVERHATSKLVTAEDLATVKSFGFRGEALAAIASVSRMELRSSVAHSEGGAEILVEYGHSSSPVPVAAQKGTSVRVMDLFGRLPARKKFLRSVSTEFAYCARVVKEAALAHPSVSIKLFHQGELLQSYVPQEPQVRFWSCFKPNWEPIEITEESSELQMYALLSPPEGSAQRSELFLFINRRPVRNRTLLAAIRNAYLDTFGRGYEPTGAVYLTIAYDTVDVNAHPQKTEVRCLFPEKLYAWIYHGIVKRLAGGAFFTADSKRREGPENRYEKLVAKLGNRYLVYVDSDGIVFQDSRKEGCDGQQGRVRLGLLEIENMLRNCKWAKGYG